MKDRDIFYYNILNINKKENQIDIIEEIVRKNANEIKYTDGFCKVMANNISVDLKQANIAYKIINTKSLSFEYEHEFIIAYYKKANNIEYVIIDPTYKQFVKNLNKQLCETFSEWPSENLEKTKNGLELSKNLLKKGFSIVNKEEINNYINIFNINSNKINNITNNIIIENQIKFN